METPQETMQKIMDEQLQPLLEQIGFSKSGKSFYRTHGDIIDVINFQGSRSNISDKHTFYINCGLDSIAFQSVVAGKSTSKPNFVDCPFNRRISELTGTPRDYVITETTDIAAFGKEVAGDLQTATTFFDTVATTDDLLDLMIEKNFLQSYEEICRYLAKTEDIARLERYIKNLHDRFATGNRWPFFSQKIATKIGSYAQNETIAALLILS